MIGYRSAFIALAVAGSLVPVYLLAQPYSPQDRVRARAATTNAQAQSEAARRAVEARNLASGQQVVSGQQFASGQQVTLTGRIWDIPTYFTSSAAQTAQPSIIGEPASPTAQQLAQQGATSAQQGVRAMPPQSTSSTVVGGSPPTAFLGANQGTIPQGLAGTANTTPGVGGTRQTTNNQSSANLSGGNPNLTAPNPNAHTPIQGSPQGPTAQQGNAQFNTGTTGTGPVFVLQTNTGPVLISQEVPSGTTSASVLQPTATEVQVSGRLFERSGLRFMLVNANTTNAAMQGNTNFGQSGTTTIGEPPGTNFGQSGTTAVGQPPGTNFGQSGTTAVGQPQGTNFGQSGTTNTTGGGNNSSANR